MDEPKKSLGQHWLHDAAILRGIVAAVGITSDDTVLEIGPGLGTLTSHLIDTGAQVIAVEYDESLLGPLKARFADAPNFMLEYADILRFDFSALPAGYKIAANIPYYITSHLLRVLTDSPTPPVQAALLVQKEVAERVCAAPGDMSILAVAVQLEYEASLGDLVPAALFTPPPKVDSQVLILKKRSTPLFANLEKDRFMRLVKAGFSAKRKTLRNTLSAGMHLAKADIDARLSSVSIDPVRRAETLSLEEWHALYTVL